MDRAIPTAAVRGRADLPVSSARLFGAILAGYGAAIFVPLGISPLVRSFSAYFNALASPAALLPLVGASVARLISLEAVFTLAMPCSSDPAWPPTEAQDGR